MAMLMAFQSKLLTGFSFTILVLSWAATNFYPPCPAFTNLLSIRTDAPQLTVYAALSTNFPKFPQPPRHCLTRPATRPRHASSASRSSRVFSPSHTSSSSALVATASAAANLLPPAPYLFTANLAWSAAFDETKKINFGLQFCFKLRNIYPESRMLSDLLLKSEIAHATLF